MDSLHPSGSTRPEPGQPSTNPDLTKAEPAKSEQTPQMKVGDHTDQVKNIGNEGSNSKPMNRNANQIRELARTLSTPFRFVGTGIKRTFRALSKSDMFPGKNRTESQTCKINGNSPASKILGANKDLEHLQSLAGITEENTGELTKEEKRTLADNAGHPKELPSEDPSAVNNLVGMPPSISSPTQKSPYTDRPTFPPPGHVRQNQESTTEQTGQSSETVSRFSSPSSVPQPHQPKGQALKRSSPPPIPPEKKAEEKEAEGQAGPIEETGSERKRDRFLRKLEETKAKIPSKRRSHTGIPSKGEKASQAIGNLGGGADELSIGDSLERRPSLSKTTDDLETAREHTATPREETPTQSPEERLKAFGFTDLNLNEREQQLEQEEKSLRAQAEQKLKEAENSGHSKELENEAKLLNSEADLTKDEVGQISQEKTAAQLLLDITDDQVIRKINNDQPVDELSRVRVITKLALGMTSNQVSPQALLKMATHALASESLRPEDKFKILVFVTAWAKVNPEAVRDPFMKDVLVELSNQVKSHPKNYPLATLDKHMGRITQAKESQTKPATESEEPRNDPPIQLAPDVNVKPTVSSSCDRVMKAFQNGKFGQLTKADREQFADDLTAYHSALYVRIEPREWILNYGNKSPEKCTNLLRLIDSSNKLTGKVAEAIVNAKDAQERANAVKFFVKLEQSLLAKGNYHGAAAIHSALANSAVDRLSAVKEPSKSIASKKQQNEETLSFTNNYANLRQKEKDVKPIIPWAAVSCADVNGCIEGNQAYDSGAPPTAYTAVNRSNISRSLMLANLTAKHSQAQARARGVEQGARKQEYNQLIHDLNTQSTDNDALYKSSLITEPRKAS